MSIWEDYLASVDGVAINVDGNHGAQCWDLWSHYAMNVFGASMWQTSTDSGGNVHVSGYACGIWHGFGGNLNWAFTPISASQPGQRGDVAIWEWGSPAGPQSHVALVVEDRGGSLLCMTQNPGASHYGQLSKGGLLGYLRPDNQSIFDGASAPAASKPVTGGVSELADAVLRGDYGNGPARQAALGDRFAEVQNEVNRRLGGGAPAPTPVATGTQHEVVSGDTLWGLAEQYLGSGTRYMEIFNASSFRSGDPGIIYPGEIAIIP